MKITVEDGLKEYIGPEIFKSRGLYKLVGPTHNGYVLVPQYADSWTDCLFLNPSSEQLEESAAYEKYKFVRVTGRLVIDFD